MLYDKDGRVIEDNSKVLYRWQDHKTGDDITRLGQIRIRQIDDKQFEFTIAYLDGYKYMDYFDKPFSKKLIDIEVCDEQLYKSELSKWSSQLAKRN